MFRSQEIQSPDAPGGLDDAIRRGYSEREPNVNGIAARFGLTRRAVVTRAINLGVCKPVGAPVPWSDDEKRIVVENAYLSPKTIQRKLVKAGYPARTETAIGRKRRELMCREDALSDAGLMSVSEIATALGVAASLVRQWIARGWLKAVEVEWSSRTAYRVKTSELKRFFAESIIHVPVNELNKCWVVDILTSRC